MENRPRSPFERLFQLNTYLLLTAFTPQFTHEGPYHHTWQRREWVMRSRFHLFRRKPWCRAENIQKYCPYIVLLNIHWPGGRLHSQSDRTRITILTRDAGCVFRIEERCSLRLWINGMTKSLYAPMGESLFFSRARNRIRSFKETLERKKSRKKVASPHLSEETFLLMLQGGPKMAVKLGRSWFMSGSFYHADTHDSFFEMAWHVDIL